MDNLRAVKDNREYTLTSEEEKNAYRARGFDIVDEKGNIKEYGAGKKVSLEEFITVKAECDKLASENKALKKENKELKKSGEGQEDTSEKGE